MVAQTNFLQRNTYSFYLNVHETKIENKYRVHTSIDV